MSYITRADCAEAAAAVMTTFGHENAIYDITGPELVGVREIAVAAAAVSGRNVDIVAGSAADASGFGIEALGFVTRDFEMLTDRAPTTVQAFLEADREALSGG